MAKPKDLIAVDVHADDVGDYHVTEPGWYAVDDADKVVLGPFDSLRQCERAIADRKRMINSPARAPSRRAASAPAWTSPGSRD